MLPAISMIIFSHPTPPLRWTDGISTSVYTKIALDSLTPSRESLNNRAYDERDRDLDGTIAGVKGEEGARERGSGMPKSV